MKCALVWVGCLGGLCDRFASGMGIWGLGARNCIFLFTFLFWVLVLEVGWRVAFSGVGKFCILEILHFRNGIECSLQL